jgi:serine/threonine protein phosphatase 1
MVFVIGDIHGLYDPLKALIEYIYDQAGQGEKISKIIFLGDYIDCGPSSLEVVDSILRLRQDFETITLLGNHEEMLLSFYNKTYNHMEIGNMWLNYNGGVQTIRSFYPQSVLLKNGSFPDEKEVSDLLHLENILKLEERYADFFMNLPASFQMSLNQGNKRFDLLFSHSVPSPRHTLDEQLAIRDWQGLQEYVRQNGCSMDETLVWNRQLLTKQLREGLTVVHGHTPTRYYRQMTKLLRMWEEDDNAPYVVREKKSRQLVQIDLDTGLIYGGSLTMLAIDDAPDSQNIFPYYISVDPGRGLRHRLFSKKELYLV